MLAQQRAVGSKVEQRAVERAPAKIAVPLDDANRHHGIGFTGRRADRLRGRTGHGDGIGPVAFPQLSALGCATADHHAEREAARVGRDERFRKEDQLCAFGRGLLDQPAGLFDCGLTVEENGRGLGDGDSRSFEVYGHVVAPGLGLIHEGTRRSTMGWMSIRDIASCYSNSCTFVALCDPSWKKLLGRL